MRVANGRTIGDSLLMQHGFERLSRDGIPVIQIGQSGDNYPWKRNPIEYLVDERGKRLQLLLPKWIRRRHQKKSTVSSPMPEKKESFKDREV